MTDVAHDYELVWFKELPKYATLGRFFDRTGLELCVALGLPWLDADQDGHRDRMKSRFVAGLYRVSMRISRKNGGTGKRDFDVPQFASDDGNPLTTFDTPDTEAAQIHPANWPWQLHGCVAPGSGFSELIYRGETLTAARDARYPRVNGKSYFGVTGSVAAFAKVVKDIRATMARERRDHVWIRVTDRIPTT